MHIVVIHGSPRKGNTYQAAQRVLDHLRSQGPLTVTTFCLPQDMPHFCMGCNRCFERGEQDCPHAAYTLPIRDAMVRADGLIFTTPVYVLRESGAMKALLDHFAYQFIVHRARPEMFTKKALVISTTAGGGLGAALGAVKTSLVYWGVNRVMTVGMALHATSWEDTNQKRRARLLAKLDRRANAFGRELASGRKRVSYPILYLMYYFMRLMMQGKLFGTSEDTPDKRYWKEQGYMKKRPF